MHSVNRQLAEAALERRAYSQAEEFYTLVVEEMREDLRSMERFLESLRADIKRQDTP